MRRELRHALSRISGRTFLRERPFRSGWRHRVPSPRRPRPIGRCSEIRILGESFSQVGAGISASTTLTLLRRAIDGARHTGASIPVTGSGLAGAGRILGRTLSGCIARLPPALVLGVAPPGARAQWMGHGLRHVHLVLWELAGLPCPRLAVYRQHVIRAVVLEHVIERVARSPF